MALFTDRTYGARTNTALRTLEKCTSELQHVTEHEADIFCNALVHCTLKSIWQTTETDCTLQITVRYDDLSYAVTTLAALHEPACQTISSL
jgi:hypothetical protein